MFCSEIILGRGYLGHKLLNKLCHFISACSIVVFLYWYPYFQSLHSSHTCTFTSHFFVVSIDESLSFIDILITRFTSFLASCKSKQGYVHVTPISVCLGVIASICPSGCPPMVKVFACRIMGVQMCHWFFRRQKPL